LPSVLSLSTTSLLASLLSTSLGRRLNFSVLEETKMGVRPGRPAGNLGGVMERPAGFSVVFSCLFPFLSCLSLNFCRSFSLALNGDGLRIFRLVTIEG